MRLDYQKELTPVVYGDAAIKVLHFNIEENKTCFPTHWHERMELILVNSGSLDIISGNRKNIVNAGELAIFTPCQPHYATSKNTPVDYSVIMFDIGYFLNNTLSSKKFLHSIIEQKISFQSKTNESEIIDIIKEIIKYSSNNTVYNNLYVIGCIYALIGSFYKYCFIEKIQEEFADNRFKNVIDYINNHYKEPISSYSLSKMFNYDEAYFCRRFKATTGLTAIKYIKILRLEYAQKLLKNSNLSIKNISEICGFSDAVYFASCFKKHFGLTPSEYQKRIL